MGTVNLNMPLGLPKECVMYMNVSYHEDQIRDETETPAVLHLPFLSL